MQENKLDALKKRLVENTFVSMAEKRRLENYIKELENTNDRKGQRKI